MFWNSLVLHKVNNQKQKQINQSGFGLVELMVSISIMVIVASIIMTKQSAFNGSVLLRSQAYEVAFDLREVQLSAVSAAGNTGVFRSVLGVHFDTANAGHYAIFKDADADGFYDSGEEYGIQGALDSRFEVRSLRAVGAAITGNDVSVVFVRPNFDARFFDSSGTEINASSIEIDIARIGFTGTGPDVLRTVEVTSTGQIAVK
ncbi:prepilin-type N-terminal cleavage/methylation domain-containing protein [Candidatus Kaiserbacteria bacterium]|nr:prepilin-type N-terminal cleavage/methylation domain-containing protein [Candidatus Kaiserbacteria bacterium]